MKRTALLSALLLIGCTAAVTPSDIAVESSSSSSVSEAVSSASSYPPNAPTLHIRWSEKKLIPLIKGQPRRKLSLQMWGVRRELRYVGTFNGEAFDLAGTFVNVDDAVLKASISWGGSGDEIWIVRTEDGLTVHHRDINEDKPYLTVDSVLTKIPLERNVRVVSEENAY